MGFLYRYYDRYTNDGFKRLVNEGFSCENTMIPYTPTITACGHTCAYTGSVPAIHGIIGNNWYSRVLNRSVTLHRRYPGRVPLAAAKPQAA